MKKLSPIMACHLGIVAGLLVFYAVRMASLFGGSGLGLGLLASYGVLGLCLYVAICLANVAALVCAAVYLWHGYGRAAAGCYIALLTLLAVRLALSAWLTIIASTSAGVASYGFVIALLAIKVALLLALAFGRDLGSRNAWSVFGTFVAMDIVGSLMLPEAPSLATYRAVSVLSRIALDAVIGLSIRGKYADEMVRAAK